MVSRPTVFPRWATNDVIDPTTNINNVVEPPESKKNVGWNLFESPARQLFNWLGRVTYQWIVYLDDKVTNGSNTTDGTGAVLVNQEDVLVTLTAIDSTTPANFLTAVGYRGSSSPVFNVIDSNVLTLGSASSDGSQAILGGNANDIIINVKMEKI